MIVVGLALADERRQSGSSVRTGTARHAALDAAGGAGVIGLLLMLERLRRRPLWQQGRNAG